MILDEIALIKNGSNALYERGFRLFLMVLWLGFIKEIFNKSYPTRNRVLLDFHRQN